MEIFTDKYEIYESGTIIIPDGESVTFNIENLKFRISFSEVKNNDGSPGAKSFNVKLNESENVLDITFLNMKDAIYSTNSQMTKLAKLRDKELYLKFSITSINNVKTDNTCDYLMYYTWYLAK